MKVPAAYSWVVEPVAFTLPDDEATKVVENAPAESVISYIIGVADGTLIVTDSFAPKPLPKIWTVVPVGPVVGVTVIEAVLFIVKVVGLFLYLKKICQ